MDFETIIYIAIFILFSIFSGKKAKKKKQEQEGQGQSLEDEIRRMMEKMQGKEEEPERQTLPETYTQPETYKTETYESPYKSLESTKSLETEEEVVDYSEQDVKRVEEEQRRYRDFTPTNYEAVVTESARRGKEKHSIIEHSVSNSIQEHAEARSEFIENLDIRKAIIYAEIFGKPKSETM